MEFKTEQEVFWSGEFGDEYIDRNQSNTISISNIELFGRMLKSAPNIKSIVELGCNIGLNLKALNQIYDGFELCGYEINHKAACIAKELQIANIIEGTILETLTDANKYDLAFTKGVLIHIAPDQLEIVYDNLYHMSKQYIIVCEYYNPSPVVVKYRGNDNKLFKRDFAGELIDKYKLKLIDYGFIYHRDNYFPQDDLTWFLMEK